MVDETVASSRKAHECQRNETSDARFCQSRDNLEKRARSGCRLNSCALCFLTGDGLGALQPGGAGEWGVSVASNDTARTAQTTM